MTDEGTSSPGTQSARTLRWAGLAFVTLFLTATAVQLRPFWWDTLDPAGSLRTFDRHRVLIMSRGWVRVLLLFPSLVLAWGLGELLRDDHRPAVSVGRALISVSAVLGAISGLVGPVIGVAAESYFREGGAVGRGPG